MSTCLSIFLYVYLINQPTYIHVYASTCLSFCKSTSLSLFFGIYLITCLHNLLYYLYFYLLLGYFTTCLFFQPVYLSIYLTFYKSTNLLIFLTVYLISHLLTLPEYLYFHLLSICLSILLYTHLINLTPFLRLTYLSFYKFTSLSFFFTCLLTSLYSLHFYLLLVWFTICPSLPFFCEPVCLYF